jgi:hypothetical protein
MAADLSRLQRIRRLHRVQANLARREDMKRAALDASRRAITAREAETVARFGSDEALGSGATDLVRRLAALSAQRRAVDEEVERLRPRLVREKSREAVLAKRLALLDAAAADKARRAELIDIVEARLGRALALRRYGGKAWRST